MDSLSYGYNLDVNGHLENNRLRHVRDAIADGNYTVDIDSQGDDNYEYDATGNLVKDTKEGITSIEWTVYGKIKKITKANGTIIRYTYDVTGNRISKAVTEGENTTITWYTRDAQGNTMAVYTEKSANLNLAEHHLYGSSRLGVWSKAVDMDGGSNNPVLERGNKFFELSNHLGNVLVTTSDKKIAVDEDTDGDIDFYLPDVVSASDYYPFGMQMVGRKFDAGKYRYGFNGKEKDSDVKGEGVQYDYGFRIYDSRVGKFLSTDPLSQFYPWYTPYQFAGNKPIYAIDLDGLEERPSIYEKYYGSIYAKPQLTQPSVRETTTEPNKTKETPAVLTVGDPRKTGQKITALQNGENALEKSHSDIYFKNRQDDAIATVYEFAKLTDLNDLVVIATWINRGKENAINIDGTETGVSGVNFAIAGCFIPAISGSLVKKASALIEGSVRVFKNGVEVLENAVKIGKYGFKGTKAYNEVVRAVQAGGNIVANSKEEALKFLKEAFPDIVDDTNKTTSRYGYRIDDDTLNGGSGLKQGHQGWHINYYDKDSGIKGTILVDAVEKTE